MPNAITGPSRPAGLPAAERERPVSPIRPDRSSSRELGPRFSGVSGERRPPNAVGVESAPPDTRESVPFLAQLIAQQHAGTDRGGSDDDSRRTAAIVAYRRSQAALGEAALVFDSREILPGNLGRRVDITG